MKLQSPFIIGPRLLPAVKVGEAYVYLERTRDVGEYGKQVFRWTIDLPPASGKRKLRTFTGADLCGHGGLQEMFGSLLAFLGACGESVKYAAWHHKNASGENADLFPPAVGQWAAENEDEISCVLWDIEDGTGAPRPGLLVE